MLKFIVCIWADDFRWNVLNWKLSKLILLDEAAGSHWARFISPVDHPNWQLWIWRRCESEVAILKLRLSKLSRRFCVKWCNFVSYFWNTVLVLVGWTPEQKLSNLGTQWYFEETVKEKVSQKFLKIWIAFLFWDQINSCKVLAYLILVTVDQICRFSRKKM